jgi:hypothetical protein
MRNAMTLNEIGASCPPTDRKRLGALLLEGFKTPVGSFETEIMTTPNEND